jgi:hypothetical protein
MEQLRIRSTDVSDLVPLADMKKLRKLDLRETPVSDLSPLVALGEAQIVLTPCQQVIVPNELNQQVERRVPD